MVATHNKLMVRFFHWLPERYASSFLLGIEGWLVALALRVILTCFKTSELFSQPFTLFLIFMFGALADLTAVSVITFGQALLLSIPSDKFFHSAKGKCLTILLCIACQFIFFFSAVAEVFFWLEFESRFNFIAVDYLTYTTEVIANIMQSYPVIPIVLLTLLLACAGTYIIFRNLRTLPPKNTSALQKIACCTTLLALAALTSPISLELIPATFEKDKFAQELAKNGLCSFVEAFFQNHLDYEQFYKTLPLEEVGQILRRELADDNAEFVSDNPLDVRRTITAPGKEQRWNVILILEESLSASFIGALDAQPGKSLTPRFDELCTKGILLDKCFASGTRTVRGIEAVTLSLPPTPGQSIVKRPSNHNLFSMGTVFTQKGYTCTFIYGGNGFFDNMNDFFSDNHYRILDCNADEAEPKTFSNAWGNCDGDVFQWALHDADRLYEQNKPFHQFILTTSNHRPYTFPENTIDAEQGHRSSAVKYSDFALAEFLHDAEKHPWFDSTLFVVLADHCHSTSGRSALALNKYHIPALFYNPILLQPQRISTVCSQIDITPTIFALLNWSYTSEFFGKDITKLTTESSRAYPGTFQNLGFLNGSTGKLTTMLVKKHIAVSQWDTQMPFTEMPSTPDDEDIRRSIALYQVASIRFAKRLDVKFREDTTQKQNISEK